MFVDASRTKIGGLIIQGHKFLDCYSRSLPKHYIDYTTKELELLSIVEQMREYRTMLLGYSSRGPYGSQKFDLPQ